MATSKLERECFSYLDDCDEVGRAETNAAYMPAMFDISKERARAIYEQWLANKEKAA